MGSSLAVALTEAGGADHHPSGFLFTRIYNMIPARLRANNFALDTTWIGIVRTNAKDLEKGPAPAWIT